MAKHASLPSSLFGLLVVDKPKGPTSMDVVRVVRRRAGGAKTGHAGTLDPLASGVLLICIGRAATRCVPQLMATDKEYRATIDFSGRSETDDAEGPIHPVRWSFDAPPTLDTIETILQQEFTGEILQRPPAHSAMKVGGRRAYKMARKGEQVELKARPVIIHEIRYEEFDWPRLMLTIRCGKGTYIRSLARDLGEALGGGAYLSELVRTAVGQFSIDQAIPLDDVPDPLEARHLLPVPSDRMG